MTIKSAIIATSIGALCLSLGACASTEPATPHAAVMPGRGKSYAAFQRDDAYCQNQGQAAIGGQSPGQAANDAAVGSAVVGTALGAAAGAALGSAWHRPGTGAAVGAGEGLVVGSAVGAGNGRAAGAEVQGRYDRVLFAMHGGPRQRRGRLRTWTWAWLWPWSRLWPRSRIRPWPRSGGLWLWRPRPLLS